MAFADIEARTPTNQIFETTDHDQFRMTICNRKISPFQVAKLKASIRKQNLLHLRPILVNNRMEVVDGQHRLVAAKQLGLPVFYQFDSGHSIETLELLNSANKTWASTDWLEHWCGRGVADYIRLREFCVEHRVNIAVAKVYDGSFTRADDLAHNCEALKNGTFKFNPSEKDLKRLRCAIAVAETAPSAMEASRILKNQSFHIAVAEVLKYSDYDELTTAFEMNGFWRGKPATYEQFSRILVKTVNSTRKKHRHIVVLDMPGDGVSVVSQAHYKRVLVHLKRE